MRSFWKSGNKSVKVVIGGSLCVLIIVAVILGNTLFRTKDCMANSNEDKYFTNITVKRGDTLWDIAQEYMDKDHYSTVREYVHEIKRMNNLTSDKIYVGQSLIITYYSTPEELHK